MGYFNLSQFDERSIGSALTNGKIDVAIAWDISIPSGLHCQRLGTIPPSVLVQSSHLLAEQEAVTLRGLVDQPLVFPAHDRQPIIWDTYRRYTAEYGFEPHIVMDVNPV